MANTQAKIKRMKRRRILWTIILAVVVVVVLGFIILFRVFTLRKLDISGCSLYPSSVVEKEIKSGKNSWNSLFVYMRYRDGKMEDLPYIDSVKVSMETPHELKVKVTEKEILGGIYDSSLKKYVYFDSEGTALRISSKKLSDEILIRGLEAKNISLYERMNFTNGGVLETLQSLTSLLKKYDSLPESISVRSGNTFLLDYGDIQVNLGTGMYLNEKVVRMVKILPKLKGKKGVLHVETWTESTTDIYFRSGETVDSAGSSSSGSDSSSSSGSEGGSSTAASSDDNGTSQSSGDASGASGSTEEAGSAQENSSSSSSSGTGSSGTASETTGIGSTGTSAETSETGTSAEEGGSSDSQQVSGSGTAAE